MASSSSKSYSCIRPIPPTGYYDSDMTEEELAAYVREVKASEGFDVQTFSDECGGISPMSNVTSDEHLRRGATEAIIDYNVKNGTNFEVVEILKATVQVVCGLRYYITFNVRPIDTPADYPTTTFQAKVIYGVQLVFTIELCRIKPGN